MTATQRFKIGSLRFQQGSRVVERVEGEPVKLSLREYAILLQLCHTGFFRDPDKRRLDNVIYRLRNKLGLDAQILCDWKNGYRLLNSELLT